MTPHEDEAIAEYVGSQQEVLPVKRDGVQHYIKINDKRLLNIEKGRATDSNVDY